MRRNILLLMPFVAISILSGCGNSSSSSSDIDEEETLSLVCPESISDVSECSYTGTNNITVVYQKSAMQITATDANGNLIIRTVGYTDSFKPEYVDETVIEEPVIEETTIPEATEETEVIDIEETPEPTVEPTSTPEATAVPTPAATPAQSQQYYSTPASEVCEYTEMVYEDDVLVGTTVTYGPCE